MAKKSSFDFLTVAKTGIPTPSSAPVQTQTVQASSRATQPSGGFDFSTVASSAPVATPTPSVVKPVVPVKKKDQSGTGLFGGMFSTDGDSSKIDDKTSWYDWDSIKTGLSNGLDFSEGAAQTIMGGTNRMLGGAFTLAGGILDVGTKELTSLVDKYVYGNEEQAEKDLKADAQGLAKYLLDAGDYIKRNEDVMKPVALRNLGVSEKNISPDKNFLTAYSEGDLADGTRLLFHEVANTVPQLVLAAYTGGSSLTLTRGGLLAEGALAAEGTGLLSAAAKSLGGTRGAQFKFGLGLGSSMSIAEEYAKDKNISAGELFESVSRGIIEGISETLFDTDIKAARQLFRNFVDTSENPAIRGIANSILSEGEEATREKIVRSAWDVMKKGFTAGKNEGLEEVASSFGNLLIDATKNGGFTMEDFDKFKSDATQSFIVGFLSGGLPSAYVAARTRQKLTDEQKKTIDRYSEIVNNPETTQEAKAVAKERIQEIIDYNADLNKSTYRTIANLPIDKREEALGYLDEIKRLEESKKTARELTPEFDEQIRLKQEKVDGIVEEHKLDLADELLNSPEAINGNVAFSNGTQLTVTPDTGYVFNFDSPQDVPEALRQIEPISSGTVEGRQKSAFRVSYTGQDLIDAGLARQAAEISNEQIAEVTTDLETTTKTIQDLLDNTPDALSEILPNRPLEEGETVAGIIAEQYLKDKERNTDTFLRASVEEAIRKGMQQKVMAAEPVVTAKPKRKRNVQTLRGMKPTEGVELSTNMVNDFTGVLGKLGRGTKQTLQNYVRALKSVRPEAKVFYYEDANAMEKGLRNSGYSAARAKQYAASSGGLFTTVNKGAEVVIHVNRQADLSKMGENAGRQSNIVLAHEIVHATLLDLAKTNPSEFVAMKDSLLKMLARDEAANEEIKEFVKRYSDRKIEVQAEEFLAQLGALITRQQATLKRSTLEKIKIGIREFLQKVASKFRSKALMDLVENEVFSDTAKAEDTARFLEGLGKSLREGTDINMKYIKNLTKGSREYQQGLRYSILETASPMPDEMDANTLMNNDMVVEPDDVKQSISEGNWLDNADNKKRLAKYTSNIKGMTNDDIWLAKAISYNEDKGVKLYTLKDKESVIAAIENQLNNIEESLNNEITGQFEFARDGELWEKNGGYLFTGWKPAYITRKINYFSDPNTYNANELLRWNKIAEDQNYHKQEVGVIRDIQKKDLLANIKEFNGHNDFDPAFSYMLINSMIYNKYQIVENEETKEQEIVSFKYKQNQLAETDGTYNTIQYDVAKKLYDSEGSIQSTEELGMAYQKTFMGMGKMDVVNSKFNKYIDKKSSTGEGYWLKFEQGVNPEASYDLFEIAKTSHKYPAKWCTGNSDTTSASQLKGGDFYVFVDSKTGDARIAVRYTGNTIAEVRGLGEGQAILPQDSKLIEEVVGTFKDGKSYESYSNTLKDIKNIASSFLTNEEFNLLLERYGNDSGDALTIEREKLFSDFIAKNHSLEDIVRILTEEDRSYGESDYFLKNIQSLLRVNLYDVLEAKGENKYAIITDDYYTDSKTTWGEVENAKFVKYILGNLTLYNDSQIKFDNLIRVDGAIEIGGYQTFFVANNLKNAQAISIMDGGAILPSLESIDRGLEIDGDFTQFEAKNLKKIGSGLYMNIDGDNLIKLDSLEEVHNISLKLKDEGLSFEFPKLKKVGRSLKIDTSSIPNDRNDYESDLLEFDLNLPSIEVIGGTIGAEGMLYDKNFNKLFSKGAKINVNILSDFVNIDAVFSSSSDKELNINVKSATINDVTFSQPNSKININSEKKSKINLIDGSVKGELNLKNVNSITRLELVSGAKVNSTDTDIKIDFIQITNDGEINSILENVGKLTLDSQTTFKLSAKSIIEAQIGYDSSFELLDNDYIGDLTAKIDSFVNLKSTKEIKNIFAQNGSRVLLQELLKADSIELVKTDNFLAYKLRDLNNLTLKGNIDSDAIKIPNVTKLNSLKANLGSFKIDYIRDIDNIQLYESVLVAPYLNNVNEIILKNSSEIYARNLQSGYSASAIGGEATSKEELSNMTALIEDFNGKNIIPFEEQEEPSDVKESIIGDFGTRAKAEFKKRTEKTLKQRAKESYSSTFERNEVARKAFIESDMPFSMYSMYLKAGASPFAMKKYADAYFKIYDGLDEKQINELDDVIFFQRVIAIDENFDNRGKKRPSHPDYVDKSGKRTPVNREMAMNAIDEFEKAKGKEYADDMRARAKEYFNTFSDILKAKYDNGIISKETYEMYKDYNYSPRKFLEYIVDVNGVPVNTFTNRGINITDNDIKNIQKGSTDLMVSDSARLLKMAIISAENKILTNRALKYIFEEGTTRKNNIVKDANYVKLKDNTIKLEKDGTPVVKKADDGFVNRTYLENGKVYTFQMRRDISNEFDDTDFSNVKGTGEKILQWLSASAVTRQLAVTLDPFFGLVNGVLDMGTQVIFSNTYKGAGRGLIAQSIEAAKVFSTVQANMVSADFAGTRTGKKFGISESASSGEIRQLMEEYGYYGGFMTTMSEVGKDANWLAKGLSYYGNVTEIAAKVGAYKFIKETMLKDFAKENIDPATGDSIEPTQEQMRDIMITAAYQARATLDYNRGGQWGKTLSQYIPFLNVSLQIKKVGGQYIVNNPADFARKMFDGILVTAAITLMNLIIGADDYEKDPKIKREKLDKTIIMLPLTLQELGLSDKPDRAYIPLPTPTLAKNFFNIGQIIAEQIYYDAVGKVNPNTNNGLTELMYRNYEMFSHELVNTFIPKTIQAGLSYFFNYDFWTREKLTRDDRMVPSKQGYGNEEILSIYKTISQGLDKITDPDGEGFGGGWGGFSPEKLQKSVEVVTTSAKSKALVNLAYFGIDNLFQLGHKIILGEDINEKDKSKYIKENIFENMAESIGKGFGRLVKFTDSDKYDMPDFNARRDIQREVDLLDQRLDTRKSLIYKDLLKIYDESKEQKNPNQYLEAKAIEYSKKIKDPALFNYAESIGKTFYQRNDISLKANASAYYEIDKARNPESKAFAIWKNFGDVRGNEFLLEDLGNLGLDDRVALQYSGILIENELMKPRKGDKPNFESWYKKMITKK